jgi:hypothetical protein
MQGVTNDFELLGIVSRAKLVETASKGCGEARATRVRRSEREVRREKRRGVTCATASEGSRRTRESFRENNRQDPRHRLPIRPREHEEPYRRRDRGDHARQKTGFSRCAAVWRRVCNADVARVLPAHVEQGEGAQSTPTSISGAARSSWGFGRRLGAILRGRGRSRCRSRAGGARTLRV